eukprot:jgi/Chrzof1/8535/Cz03g14210.t1
MWIRVRITSLNFKAAQPPSGALYCHNCWKAHVSCLGEAILCTYSAAAAAAATTNKAATMSVLASKLTSRQAVHVLAPRSCLQCRCMLSTSRALLTSNTRFRPTHLFKYRTLTSLQQSRPPCLPKVSPFDQAWGTQIDGQSLASQLFALSLFPYLAFLYYLTRSGKAPKVMLFGFYFLLAFVGATIPAGIYAKTHYHTSLANVDWLHGSAESLLTITNLLIVVGLRQAIREVETQKAQRLADKAVAGEQQTKQQVDAEVVVRSAARDDS